MVLAQPLRVRSSAPLFGGRFEINVAATYFPTPVRRSIMGPLRLNCRVRDGNGCDPQGIATTKAEFVVVAEGCCEAERHLPGGSALIPWDGID